MRDEIGLTNFGGEQSIDVRHLLEVVLRHKWQIIGFAFLMGLLAVVGVMLITPQYKAGATILIEAQEANVVSIDEVYGLEMRNQQYYDTQFEILKSRPIAEAVIENTGLASREETSPLGEGAGLLTKLGHKLRSKLADLFASDDIDSAGRDLESVVRSYQKRLEVEPVGKTQLVNIFFESPDPAVAAEMANAHARAYIDSILDARVEVTQSASSWMSRRVEDLKSKLVVSEQALQSYREQEGLIDSQGVQTLPAKEIDELTSRLVQARRDLSEARIVYQQTRAGAGGDEGGLGSVPTILSDQAVRGFRDAEAKAEQRVAELAKRYGPKHPQMLAAQSELAKASQTLARAQRSVAGSIEAKYRAAQSDVAQLERELASAKQQFQVVGRKQARLTELRREVDVNRQLYDLFYNRMQEMAQTDDLKSVNARIMSPAILPVRPFSPKKQLIIAMVVAVSGLIGIIFAFLNESFNNTLRSSDDIEKKLGVPMLGMVPLLKNGIIKGPSCAHAFLNPDEGEFSEAIRTIRTGLTLTNLDNPFKVILVTSSVSNEGKSTLAMNLAYAFGQVENVLLIDADMRRPTVGSELSIPRSHPGLTELLAEREELTECIVKRGREKLDVISSGFIPPNPLELLSSRNFGKVLGELQKRYDRIIIDSPPVLPVSDAVVLSKYADTVVYVTKSDATAVNQVRHGLSKLERVSAPLAGVILNQLDIRKAEKYSDYGYGGYYESYASYSSDAPEAEKTSGSRMKEIWKDPLIDRRRKVS